MKEHNSEPTQQLQVVEWLAPQDEPVPPQVVELLDESDNDEPVRSPWYQQAAKASAAWLIMVVIFLALALGASLAGLYFSVDTDSLPPASAHFGGISLSGGYQWKLPVAKPLTRSFAKQVPVQALDVLTSGHPELEYSGDLQAALTLRDSAGQEIFSGSPEEYAYFAFPQNGDYSGTLTLSNGELTHPEGFEAIGHYTYEFTFQLDAQPQVSLSDEHLPGGSVLGIRVDGLLGDQPPFLESELGEVGFVRLGSSWMAYLPISAYQKAGTFPVVVQYGENTVEQQVHITYRHSMEQDVFTADGTAAVPFLGDAPKQVKQLFGIADPEVYWAAHGFQQPVRGKVVRNYEMLEYVDRVVEPILRDLPEFQAYNATIRPRHSLNVTFQTTPGSKVLCPADGRVIFAGTVNGGGRCVAVEHGCGLKSVFYLLGRISVNEGDHLPQGTVLGTTQGHTICEVWMNDVSLCPWDVWRNQGGLFF